MSTKLKLLLTSIGSLLGQNILDSIESRRGSIEVVGMNSVAENARNFRSNRTYLVNETLSSDFEEQFIAIIKSEKPDIILPGRDEDCVFLSEIRIRHPELFNNNIPFGSSDIPKMMFNKYESYLFCTKHNLPIANTVLYSLGDDKTVLNKFIDHHQFPLVVKPKAGFGSNGVFFVLKKEQLFELAKKGEILIQEFLGSADHIKKYENIFKLGIPLFFQVEEKDQYSAQTLITKDGCLTDIFIARHTMVVGRTEYTRQIESEEIEDLVKKSCTVFFKHGWYGPINFQVKQNKTGIWKIFEMNPRLSGSSSTRTVLGYDEIGNIIELFYPKFDVKNLTNTGNNLGGVHKYLTDFLLLDSDVETLKKDKVWIKS